MCSQVFTLQKSSFCRNGPQTFWKCFSACNILQMCEEEDPEPVPHWKGGFSGQQKQPLFY